jgi:hypothetical protein
MLAWFSFASKTKEGVAFIDETSKWFNQSPERAELDKRLLRK